METWKHGISETSQLSFPMLKLDILFLHFVFYIFRVFLDVRTTFPPHGDLACTYSLFCSPLSKTLENKLSTTHLSAVLLIHQIVLIKSYSFLLQEVC